MEKGKDNIAAESLDPLRLLQEDLKDDDYEQAIASIKRLSTIALAMGPQRTRNELLPFLVEFSETDNDEGQTAVAAQLGDFIDLVGGPAHGHLLLPLLEKLAGEEESVVRTAAVESLVKVVGKIERQDVNTKFLPLIRRLASGEWFTTRVSSSHLFAPTYNLVPDQTQDELRALFKTLCDDDTPMVRKAAYQNLGSFSLVVQKDKFKSDFLPILKALSQDDLDSMRVFTIDTCAVVSTTMDAAEFQSLLLPLLDAMQDDASWRVRKALAEKMPDLCTNVNEGIASKRLIPIFAKLLRDKEAEVRTAAAAVVHRVCAPIKSGLPEHIGPVLEPLATDQVQNVRVAFSKTLAHLCGPFGKEAATKMLLPIIQQLTKDENYEVRNNIIEDLEVLSNAIGPAGIANSLLPALLELSKDPKWRVRHAIIAKSAMLALQMGARTFEKKLQNIIIVSLSDHVFAIRAKCCEQIGEIVRNFGGKWAAEKFFPAAFAIYDKTANYLHRMTCLLLILHVAPVCGSEIIDKILLPLVLNASTDDVPNVRISAAKTLGELSSAGLEKSISKAKILPALQKLAKDVDADVQFFGLQSLKKCEKICE